MKLYHSDENNEMNIVMTVYCAVISGIRMFFCASILS